MSLLAPFSFPFMQSAFLVAALIALPTALLSCFLVLKGWSLMGDAVSHAVFPGIVLAYIAGIPLVIGAFSAGITCALAAGYLKENSRVKEDTVLGVVFSGMFGLGLILFTSIETDIHLDHILFGDMLGMDSGRLIETAFITLGAALILIVKWRDISLYIFDPKHAQAIGLPTRVLHYGLLSILALTVVGTLKAAGIIITVAMLITPGATAFLITDRFAHMLWISLAVGIGCSLGGVYLCFFLDSAPAPTIGMLLSGAFIITLSFRSK